MQNQFTSYGYNCNVNHNIQFNGDYIIVGNNKSNLILMGHGVRLYNPSLRRTYNADSYSYLKAKSINPYAFVNNDPINHNDPSGHMPKKYNSSSDTQDIKNMLKNNHLNTKLAKSTPDDIMHDIIGKMKLAQNTINNSQTNYKNRRTVNDEIRLKKIEDDTSSNDETLFTISLAEITNRKQNTVTFNENIIIAPSSSSSSEYNDEVMDISEPIDSKSIKKEKRKVYTARAIVGASIVGILAFMGFFISRSPYIDQ